MTALILKSNIWYLIEELPEEPKPIKGDIGNLCYRSLRRDYEYILQRAINNAVRVENQEVAKNILLRALNWNPHPDEHRFEPDKVYPVEVSYEIDYFDPLGERLARLLPCKEAEIERLKEGRNEPT